MKLAGVVVIYNPVIEEVIKNINLYLKYLDLLIIWDNTPGGTKGIENLVSAKKIIIQGYGENVGISKALNKSYQIAFEMGYEYILSMDQDSTWDNFENYIRAIEQNKSPDIGIYAPQIKSRGTILRVNSVSNVITSGSVINLNIFRKIGGYNEKLFIDEVDNELCFRLTKYGYKILVLSSTFLHQVFGNPGKENFLNRFTSHYSAFRTYYQIRNRLWVWKVYHSQLSYKYLLRTIWVQIFRRHILILLIEQNKKEKLKAITKGIIDGIKNHL